MRAYDTLNSITMEMAALMAQVTGRASLTAGQQDIVYGSIVDAMQLCLLEYGVQNFRFLDVIDTEETTAGTAYVDLDDYVFRIVPGTVRIASERLLLTLINEEVVYAQDPDLSETGVPLHYYYAPQGTVNAVRMGLWPTPDAAYTISMTQQIFPADSLSSFPAPLSSAIKNKAKALACHSLGISAYRAGFEATYEDLIAKLKDGYEADGPRHIGRRVQVASFPLCSERRIS